MTDRDAFLQAIIADPDDDNPRLIFADWLEEQGDGERAEFIRVQVELAAHPGMNCGTMYCGRQEGYCDECRRYKRMRQRERELWNAHHLSWFASAYAAGLRCLGISLRRGIISPQGVVRRGAVAEVHCTLQQWLGGETCEACRANRHEFAIGYAPCPSCHGTGRLPGIGPALCAVQPVQRVVTEKRPQWSVLSDRWLWEPDGVMDTLDVPHVLPRSLWPFLAPESPDCRFTAYSTEQAARDALECHALIQAARNERSNHG